jgi:hypothetical protein
MVLMDEQPCQDAQFSKHIGWYCDNDKEGTICTNEECRLNPLNKNRGDDYET